MSVRLFVLDRVIRFQMKRRFRRDPELMLLRPMMREMERRAPKLPPHVSIAQAVVGGVRGEVVRGAKCDETGAILYLHGGAFVAGSPATHRALTWRLADGVGVPVHAVDYRLAPEHRFPAGLDDVVAAYRGLLDAGISPGRIGVAGDSAGGNLTLALAHRVAAAGLPMPAALVCLSPATELGVSLESHTSNGASDAMFVPALMGKVAPLYCTPDEAQTPFVSPLRGELAGFPPTLIQCSEIEMLRDDGVLMAKRLREAGVEVELDVWPRVYHVWQLSADILPEARDAVAKIVAFLRARVR